MSGLFQGHEHQQRSSMKSSQRSPDLQYHHPNKLSTYLKEDPHLSSADDEEDRQGRVREMAKSKDQHYDGSLLVGGLVLSTSNVPLSHEGLGSELEASSNLEDEALVYSNHSHVSKELARIRGRAAALFDDE